MDIVKVYGVGGGGVNPVINELGGGKYCIKGGRIAWPTMHRHTHGETGIPCVSKYLSHGRVCSSVYMYVWVFDTGL